MHAMRLPAWFMNRVRALGWRLSVCRSGKIHLSEIFLDYSAFVPTCNCVIRSLGRNKGMPSGRYLTPTKRSDILTGEVIVASQEAS